MTDRVTVRFDGGSRGNPGPAAVGVVLEADDGTSLQAFGKFIGTATNNVAEYRGLIAGLEAAKAFGASNVRVMGDSELVIKQMRGEYKVKNETLKPLWEKAQSLLRGFDKREVGHNLRGHNSLADSLVNLAMDKKRDVSDDELPGGGSWEAPAPEPVVEGGGKRYACVNCGCVVQIVREGEVPVVVRDFRCRCGAPMRGE